MNKKGNVFFGIAIALIVWIFGILFLPFVTDDITTFRADLDCPNSSISDGTKLTCLAGGMIVPYLIWTIMSLALGFVAGGFDS